MLILAADTSLPILSVAIVRDAELLGATSVEGRSSRNEKLLPAIDWLLGETGADRRSIDIFAVTRGPGSFTGVRIGLATMQARYGDWRELFRQLDRIDKVTKADVRRVANQTFVETNRTVGIIETAQAPRGPQSPPSQQPSVPQ